MYSIKSYIKVQEETGHYYFESLKITVNYAKFLKFCLDIIQINYTIIYKC